jgi:hypothetical protein
MTKTSLPLDMDALEQLIRDGSRLVEVTRPVWQEVSKLAAKIPPRRYLPIAAGLAAVGLLGVAVATTAGRRKRAADSPRASDADMLDVEPIDVDADVK